MRRADEYIAELELSRDLSQIVVHIDCDAFYAAVEELDRPELKDVPMAVGKGVLTTCNYHARKFGCRSGMAGFVAMKLCPQLICLPLNFEKYTAKAQEVRAVLSQYDPRFESASIDEAYLNITEYCATHERQAEDVVSEMRAEVYGKAKITISAGIAVNAKLAKICSNRNKPNGQFRLASDRATIMAFMRDMPTRKVNGVGRVLERELDAIGIRSCGDIYEHRAFLSKLFGEKAFQFLMTCYLGLGRTKIRPAQEQERKSVGTESTFRDMSKTEELRDKLQWLSVELAKDLQRTRFKGRTLVLKIKLHTYEVFTRQTVPPHAVYLADELFRYSLPMLVKLEKDVPNLTLRLMGIRVTNLISMKKGDVNFFGAARIERESSHGVGASNKTTDEEGWEVWPESEFEEAAREEQEDYMEQTEARSQEMVRAEEAGSDSRGPSAWRAYWQSLAEPTDSKPVEETKNADLWSCPICGKGQAADDRIFNEHIDYCLSRTTIEKAVKASSRATPAADGRVTSISQVSKKRARSQGPGASEQGSKGQKKLSFA